MGGDDDGPRATPFTAGGEEFVVLSIPLGAAAAPPELSDAEREVFRLLLDGLPNRQIARARGTATRTVANQVAALFRKLGVGSRSELLARFVGPGASER